MEPNKIVGIAVALLVVSEALALIPAVKSNSIFTGFVNVLKWLSRK